MSDEVTGQCLCGAVRYTARIAARHIGACHCNMCLRWNGGPALALENCEAVSFEGEDNITRYRSSDWAERGFCAKCGSNLFYFLVPAKRYVMAYGSLDDPSAFEMVSQIFVDEKPAAYDFANRTEMMTGAEAIAKYGGGG